MPPREALGRRRWRRGAKLHLRRSNLRLGGRLAFLRAALDLADDAAEEWRARLEYAAHEHLGAVRTSEFFDVIVDFPDSLPAVDDLRRCLRRTTLPSRPKSRRHSCS